MTVPVRIQTSRPADGRAYEVTYVIQGELDDVRFSDWAQAELALSPAVYLRGLPAQLDLAQMPAEGWPVELGSGTQEEIGSLAATIVAWSMRTRGRSAWCGAGLCAGCAGRRHGASHVARARGWQICAPVPIQARFSFR